jgi:hypothetical protein
VPATGRTGHIEPWVSQRVGGFESFIGPGQDIGRGGSAIRPRHAAGIEQAQGRRFGVEVVGDRRQIAAGGQSKPKAVDLDLGTGLLLASACRQLADIERNLQQLATVFTLDLEFDPSAEQGRAHFQQAGVDHPERQAGEPVGRDVRPRPRAKQQGAVDGVADLAILPQLEQVRFARGAHGHAGSV